MGKRDMILQAVSDRGLAKGAGAVAVFSIILLLIGCQSSTFSEPREEQLKDPVTVSLIAEPTEISNNVDKIELGVVFSIDPGWHIYWKETGELGLPTKIGLVPPAGFSVSELRWPQPVEFTELSGDKALGYKERVKIGAELTPVSNYQAERSQVVVANIEWLACSDVCIPGEAKLEMKLKHSNN